MSASCAQVARGNEGVVRKASPVRDANSIAKVIEEGFEECEKRLATNTGLSLEPSISKPIALLLSPPEQAQY